MKYTNNDHTIEQLLIVIKQVSMANKQAKKIFPKYRIKEKKMCPSQRHRSHSVCVCVGY